MALSVAMVLSGLCRDQFTEEVQSVYSCGEVLLRSPSCSSLASTASFQSLDSGISISTEPVMKGLDRYLDIILNLGEKFQVLPGIQDASNLKIKNNYIEVIYGNRNILNLAEHLKSEWLFQHAVVQCGIANFFENRSQYSRINGATIPRHVMFKCNENDCGFKEPSNRWHGLSALRQMVIQSHS